MHHWIHQASQFNLQALSPKTISTINGYIVEKKARKSMTLNQTLPTAYAVSNQVSPHSVVDAIADIQIEPPWLT